MFNLLNIKKSSSSCSFISIISSLINIPMVSGRRLMIRLTASKPVSFFFYIQWPTHSFLVAIIIINNSLYIFTCSPVISKSHHNNISSKFFRERERKVVIVRIINWKYANIYILLRQRQNPSV